MDARCYDGEVFYNGKLNIKCGTGNGHYEDDDDLLTILHTLYTY
jgi:hypothetical protein